MDIPPAQHANISVHSHELHEEVERLRLSWQIHVAAIGDLKRVNLTYQSEIQCKDQELQLYYKHINRLIHNLNNTNFALTHTRRDIVESKHVTNESLRLMEEYKRRCEMLAEQLRHSESQKAEQEKVMRAMYEDMEKAKGYIDAPSPEPQRSNSTGPLTIPVARRNYYDVTPADFNPKGGPISATRGGQDVNSAFDRFMHRQHTSMPTGPSPVPAAGNKLGVPNKNESRSAVRGGPISANRGGQDVDSAFGRFMQQLGQSEAAAVASSQTSTPGTARFNPATAPFTSSATESQRQSQDILPPAQPIFVRPTKKPVSIKSPALKSLTSKLSEIQPVERKLAATASGSSVTSVITSQSPSKGHNILATSQSAPYHATGATKKAVLDEPRVKGTPAPVPRVPKNTLPGQSKPSTDPVSPQQQDATPYALRAWFDQMMRKNSATSSAKQSSADPGQLIYFSDPNSPESVVGGTKKGGIIEQKKPSSTDQASKEVDYAEQKKQYPPMFPRKAPQNMPSVASERDVFSQMPPDIRAAIQRVQKMPSSTTGVKALSPQGEPMTSSTLTTAQQEDKDMAAALGKLQANWSKAKWPSSPNEKENVRPPPGPTTAGSGKQVQVEANDKPRSRAFQEIREPAPLVPYASSEDSFDTRDSSRVSSSDCENSRSIGGSHVLGRYLEPEVKAMVLRGRGTNIEAPNDPLTAVHMKYMEVDRLGNQWQKVDRIGAGGRQKSGWVILNFYDPTTEGMRWT